MFLAKVFVTLKPSVNDPQGLTIKGGLHQLGYTSVRDVRAGKYLELKVNEASRAAAERKVKEMCDKLLANTVIEQYRFELEKQ